MRSIITEDKRPFIPAFYRERTMHEKISFDILLKSAGGEKVTGITDLNKFRPNPDHIENCRRWLTENGVVCHATAFGLACTAVREVFEDLFCTRVERSRNDTKQWRVLFEPDPPPAITAYIAQVTITHRPQFY